MRLVALLIAAVAFALIAAQQPTTATEHDFRATLEVERVTATAVRMEQVQDYNLFRGCKNAYVRLHETKCVRYRVVDATPTPWPKRSVPR